METIEVITEKLKNEANKYPFMRQRMKNEKGVVYCANRVSHMMKHDNCSFSGACAWLESELEGMD